MHIEGSHNETKDETIAFFGPNSSNLKDISTEEVASSVDEVEVCEDLRAQWKEDTGILENEESNEEVGLVRLSRG